MEESFKDAASMTSRGYFLTRRDIVREPSSFCSMLSSAMRRLYLKACEKTILSLHLSGWLEWKCRSATQSVSFLYRVVESLCVLLYGSSYLGRIFLGWSVRKWI